MTGKPWQSVLLPHENEINLLRRRRPPCSYARIAEILREKYQISVRRETIFKFVKVRSQKRKVYAIYGAPLPQKQNAGADVKPQAHKPAPPAQVIPASTPAAPAASVPKPKPKPFFYFQFSEHYNLHRLTHEEAEALRQQLRKEREMEEKANESN